MSATRRVCILLLASFGFVACGAIPEDSAPPDSNTTADAPVAVVPDTSQSADTAPPDDTTTTVGATDATDGATDATDGQTQSTRDASDDVGSMIASRLGNLIEDNFQRADATSWGTTTNADGLANVAWSGPLATAATASIGAHGGVFAWPGSNTFVLGYPGTQSFAGGDVLAAFDFTAAGQSQAWLMLDATSDAQNHYLAAVRTYDDSIAIVKKVAGVGTTLATGYFHFVANVTYWVRFDATAGGVRMRVWPDGQTEPSTWALDATDGSLTVGQPGVAFNWQSTGTRQQVVLQNFAYAQNGFATVASPGVSPRAAPAGCVPTTCLAAGATCGSIPDGCGGTLTCGSCPSGTTCGAYAPNSCGHVYYVSPSGTAAGSGTRDAPWQSFTTALSALRPGDTLSLLDGTYTASTSGMLRVRCGINTVSGTASLPITVRADHFRRASIEDDGTTGWSVWIVGCSYWNVVGLRARANDAVVTSGASGAESVFQITQSDHINLYRVFGEYNNRLYNSQVIALDQTSYSSVIESEVYNFHRHGIDTVEYTSIGNFFQRNYVDAQPGGPCNARGTSGTTVKCGWDLECDAAGLCGGLAGSASYCTGKATGDRCGWPSHWLGQQGDEGITHYWSREGFTENNITAHSEGQQSTGHHNSISHGISIDDITGVNLGRNQACGNVGTNPTGVEAAIAEGSNDAHDMVVIGAQARGIYFCGGNADAAENFSIYGERGEAAVHAYGLLSSGTTCQPCVVSGFTYPMSFSVANVAAFTPSSSYGAHVEGTFTTPWSGSYLDVWWTLSASNAYAPGITATPNWSHVSTAAITGMYDPTTGTGNMVYVPTTASTYGHGSGGGNIGANVTCLYDHGTNTMQPMWHAGDGRFAGCAWYAPGSNDDTSAVEGYVETCATANARVNVGTNGGAIPPCIP